MRSQRSAALCVLALTATAACQQNRPPLSVTDRATIAACTQHANQVYDRLNRGTIYNAPQTGLPNSSTGLMGDPTAGLTQRYAYDDMVNRCVRQIGTGADVNQPGIKESPVKQ